MVDITEISAIVAAAGVLIGVVYYILDMRNQTRIRKTDIFSLVFAINWSSSLSSGRNMGTSALLNFGRDRINPLN
jgi:hypothetical protein